MTTGVYFKYYFRENCIAPGIASIVWPTNTNKRACAGSYERMTRAEQQGEHISRARSNSNLNACPEAADTSRMSATKHEPYRLRTDSAKPRLMDPRSRQPGLKRVHSHRVRLVCRAHMCARAFGDRKWSWPGGMGAGCNVWEIELQATRVQLCAHGISYGNGT